jgi:hypothetical protein
MGNIKVTSYYGYTINYQYTDDFELNDDAKLNRQRNKENFCGYINNHPYDDIDIVTDKLIRDPTFRLVDHLKERNKWNFFSENLY